MKAYWQLEMQVSNSRDSDARIISQRLQVAIIKLFRQLQTCLTQPQQRNRKSQKRLEEIEAYEKE